MTTHEQLQETHPSQQLSDTLRSVLGDRETKPGEVVTCAIGTDGDLIPAGQLGIAVGHDGSLSLKPIVRVSADNRTFIHTCAFDKASVELVTKSFATSLNASQARTPAGLAILTAANKRHSDIGPNAPAHTVRTLLQKDEFDGLNDWLATAVVEDQVDPRDS